MDTLLGLVAFSFVSSVTPGPNNVLLWASGAEFGLLRTVRHILGTAVGIGLMALAAAAGLAVLVATWPWWSRPRPCGPPPAGRSIGS